MGVVFIKRTFGLKNISQVKAHAKYIGFRSRELPEEEKGFFDKDNDKFADYKKFIKRIESNRAIRHPNAVKAHKLIFSLKEVDYNAYKRSGKDYKDLIRNTLKEYEEKHNVKLDWIASLHNSEGHPHAHVIIKAVSDIKDKDGRFKRIYLKKEDFKELKGIFDKEFDKDVIYKEGEKYHLKDTFKDIDKGFKEINELGKGLEIVTAKIKYDIEKKQNESEYKKDMDIQKSIRNDRNNERER